jgi:hypothetical protein
MAKDRVKNCAIFVFRVDVSDEGKILIETIIENDDAHLHVITSTT